MLDDADNARLPTNASPNEKAVFSRNVFEHLAKLCAKAFSSQARRIFKKLIEARSLQRADAELGKDFLLTHTMAKGVQNGICRLICGFGFDDGRTRLIGGRHRIGYAASCASRKLGSVPPIYVAARNRASPAGCRLPEQNDQARRSCIRQRRPQWTGTGSKEIGSK